MMVSAFDDEWWSHAVIEFARHVVVPRGECICPARVSPPELTYLVTKASIFVVSNEQPKTTPRRNWAEASQVFMLHGTPAVPCPVACEFNWTDVPGVCVAYYW